MKKMHCKHPIFLFTQLLFALLFNFTASAQQGDTSSTFSLCEVVLTAQRAKHKNLAVPYSVSSISKNNLKNYSPRSTPDALMGINGVFVQKTNHGGGSPFVRGLTGNQVLIVIDGIRMNNSTFRYGPNQYLNTIDVYTISGIEVAKGTGSVQYGTDAIGGVVQVFTKRPELRDSIESFRGHVLAKYMTDDMEKTIRGEAEYSGERVAFITGISCRSFGDLMGGDTTGRQHFSGYNEWAFDVKAKFLVKKNIHLRLANQFLRQHNVPVYHKVMLENFAINEMNPQERLFNYARLHIAGKSSLFSETEITISNQHGVEGRNSQKNGSSILRKERDMINTIGFTTAISSTINKHWTANSGFEIYYDKVGSTRQDMNTNTGLAVNNRGLYPDHSKYKSYSLYSLHHYTFNKWTVDAGLRVNTFSIRIKDTTLGNVKISPTAFVGNAAVSYLLQRNHHLYLSFSSGYRAPNIDDMGTLGIVDFRYEVPTANLRPEKSRHTELGYKFQTKNLCGTVAAFYMNIDNLIARVKMDGQVINGYQVYKKENAESAFIKGLEAELNVIILKGWSFAASIAYTYGENQSKREPLRRIPPFNGRLVSKWQNEKCFAAIEVQFASKQNRLAQGDKDDNRIRPGGTPGWEVLNFYGGCKIGLLHLNAGFQNVFNKDYRTHGSGINAIGRSAYCTLSINF